jgi:hypothetical protein
MNTTTVPPTSMGSVDYFPESVQSNYKDSIGNKENIISAQSKRKSQTVLRKLNFESPFDDELNRLNIYTDNERSAKGKKNSSRPRSQAYGPRSFRFFARF